MKLYSGLSLPDASRSTSPRRPSASPAKSEMPIACAACSSASLAAEHRDAPDTWKPPMPTGMPRGRSGRAMSSARGNWFDCTPTSITMPAPACSIMRAMRSGRMRVLVSSKAWMSISTSSPSTFRRRSPGEPCRQASELDGIADVAMDDVAVVVVMRRLDQDETEAALRRRLNSNFRHDRPHMPMPTGELDLTIPLLQPPRRDRRRARDPR